MGIRDGHREKMRRRFLETGLEGFADHEALELLLYYAIPRRDTNPIAHALMERYDSLSGVLNAPVEDLEKVEGIGESAAILLSLVSRLSRKARMWTRPRRPSSTPPSGRGPICWSLCRRAAGAGLPAVPGPQGQAPGLQAAGGGTWPARI